ncbi:MAG: ABC transporter permease [Acidimicrobiia bacterium]|nr:ABC transporter permease [Acidimicrobiia bacterium]MDH3398132.1 ABC transporter permease [Acidimicrobiia bacterium]
MNAFAAHFSFEFRAGVRNRMLLFLNYLFPLGLYLMLGFILIGLNPFFLEVIIPGMVVIAAMAAYLLGVPEPLVGAREAGIFRSFKINGVPPSSILIIPSLTTGVHTVIVAAIITATAPVLFDAPLPINWMGFLVSLLAVIVATAGMAVVIGVVSSNSRVVILWSQLVFIPSMLLGGIMIPYSELATGVAKASRLLPATQAVNAFRALAMGEIADFDPWVSIGSLLACGFVGFGLAMFLFSWDSHNTLRRGHPALGFLVLLPLVSTLLF